MSTHNSDWQPRPQYVPYRPPPPPPQTPQAETNSSSGNISFLNKTIDPSNLPSGKKSLAGISLRAFILGQVFGLCASLAFLLYWYYSNPLWRAPFFFASLGLFHFLEYYITARYNTLYASVSAFLLSRNGAAYNIAHGSAITECLLTRLLFGDRYFAWTAALVGGIKWQLTLGAVFVVVGQIIRSLAMVQAGTSFTHTIQHERREDHVLIKDGIYSILRHPSYFGFFWWGLGTQLMLGNTLCLFAYAFVLWQFFSTRIQSE